MEVLTTVVVLTDCAVRSSGAKHYTKSLDQKEGNPVARAI